MGGKIRVGKVRTIFHEFRHAEGEDQGDNSKQDHGVLDKAERGD